MKDNKNILMNYVENVINKKIESKIMEGYKAISFENLEKEIKKIEEKPEKIDEILKVIKEYIPA